MNPLAIICAAALLALVSGTPARSAPEGVNDITVSGKFADVRQDLADAIVNRGYKIDHNAFIGDMLARTGKEVGSDRKIFSNAELVQFCSAVLSRRMMEADPANIAFCPYVIYVYERADAPGEVHVGYRRLDERGSGASKTALKAINDLLDEIIREAAGK